MQYIFGILLKSYRHRVPGIKIWFKN